MPFVLSLALALAADFQAVRLPGSPVTIDVVVTDSQGRSVATLQAGDFSVDEQGTPQPIVSVRFVKTTPPSVSSDGMAVYSREDERREAGRDDVRLFAIFLDEFHVAAGPGADRARDALARFVREVLSPRDLLVVLKPLDSLLTIQLTRDRDAALRAIESFQGRKGDYTPRTTFEQKYMAAAPPKVDAARAQIASSTLLALASHLGSLGLMRKTLIVVSEGFECGTRRRGDGLLPTLDAAVGAANRARVSIYPIDPAGLSSSTVLEKGRRLEVGQVDDAGSCESFRSIASETSGQVLAASQLASGLQQMLSDSSGYYELTLAPPLLANDGRFHAVRVRIARAGLAVRARKGYWSAVPERARTGETESPARFEMPRRISPMIRPWFGMAPAADGTTRVSFVWEPAPRVPGERNSAPRPARVALKVSKADGTQVFDGIVLPAGGYGDDVRPDRSRAVFELPPGRLRVQMSIEDLSQKVLDTDVRELVVGGFQSPLAFSTPEVLRARNAREYRALSGDLEAVPAVARQFSRQEHLLIRFRVHSSDGSTAVTARLMSSFGGPMRELAVLATARAAVYQLDLPLAGLAPGAYIVELGATSPRGQAKDLLSFTVTP